MVELRLEAFCDGDGYLVAETNEWLESHGEYAEDLTEDLRRWFDNSGYRCPDDAAIIGWITYRTGEPPVGLYGDGEAWSICLPNHENFLTEEIGFVGFSAHDEGDLVVVNATDGGYYTRVSSVYRSTELELVNWADFDSAYGACDRDHRWRVEGAHYLLREEGAHTTYRLHEQVRVPDDEDRASGYVACPECGRSIEFSL